MATGTERKRTSGAVGLLVMVIGMLLLAVPTVAAAEWTSTETNPGGNDNPDCEDIGYTIEAKDDFERVGPYEGTASGDDGAGGLFVVDYTLDETVSFVVDETSDYDVSAVIIKKGDTSSGAGAVVYYYDPAVASDSGLITIPPGADSFSHITFCAGTTPEIDPASLAIEKAVTGAEPADWSFDFAGDLGAFQLTKASPAKAAVTGLEPGEYTVTETGGTEGSTLTGVDCGEATTVDVDGGVTVTLAEGDEVTCTFTNDFAAAAAAADDTEVLGVSTTRALPQTGAHTNLLTVVGFAFLTLGLGLTATGRRHGR